MIPRCIRVSVPAIAVAVAAVVAGCGSSSSSPNGIQSQVNSPPAKGNLGNVTWDLPQGEPVPLDPTQDYNVSENQVLVNLCDQLMWVGPDFKIVPGLASSFSRPTPLTWVYNIRPGVKFWDGKPLTADDVLFSLNRQLGPTSFYFNPFGQMIASIKKTGPMQVTITTKRPNIIVNDMMASGMAVVTEKAFTEKAGKDYGTPSTGVMCSGPFKFGKWVPGQQLTIVRNPDYWNKSLVPKVQSVTFKFVTESTTITNALLSGEIDGTYDPPASAVNRLQQTSAGKLYVGQGTNFAAFNPTTSEGWKHPPLLQALSLAIDRSALAKVAFSGSASPQISPNVSPLEYPGGQQSVYDDYNKELENEPGFAKPDLEQAKKLVAQAPKPSHPLTLVVPAGDTTANVLGTTIAAEAKSIGIPIKVVPLQPADLSALFLSPDARKKYDAILYLQFWTDIADPLQHIAENYLPKSITNTTGYVPPPSIMNQYNQAIAQNDSAKRAELTVTLDKQLSKQAVYVPLVYLPQRMFLNKRITGPAASFPYVMHYPWATTLGAPAG